MDSLLTTSGLGDELEIICVLDGYWQKPVDDPRVKTLHLGKNRGMRGAINAGVAVSKGKLIMRTDEHCKFAQGFDRIMIENIRPNWITTAVRYFLDPEKWEVMDDVPPFIYEKLKIRNGKFEGQRWPKRDKARRHRKLDETMAMQGSCWVMHREWWDKVIGELDAEKYGPHFQDSHEMQFKTWKAGGKLILNKLTWFAHKHWTFKRTHNMGTDANPADADKAYSYCVNTWKEYYEKEICPKWFPS